MKAVDTVRKMARLSSASPPRIRVRLANSSTSEVASASISCFADFGDVGVTPFGVYKRWHVQFGSALSLSPRSCALVICLLVSPTCEPMITRPWPPGSPSGQICFCGK